MATESPTEKYTPESVWQFIQELGEKIKLNSEETDKKIRELSKNIGGISSSNGAMAQETIFNTLKQDLTFAGIKFDDAIPRVPVLNGFKTETDIDALMLNGDTIALIEIKYKVDKKDVKKLVFDTVDKFKTNFPKYDKYKILLGVGGMSFDDDAIDEAKENGVGIIKIVGDKVEYYTEGIREY